MKEISLSIDWVASDRVNKYWKRGRDLHREDGAALIYSTGEKYYYKNNCYTK